MGAMKPNTIILGFYDSELLKDFFEADNSPYNTEEFSGAGMRMFPIRRQGDEKTLTGQEYVAIVCDILRMNKNVCLCRHFHRLDKTFIGRSNHYKYIDVWPINAFEPKNENHFDVVSHFMMQLACIINMLPKWKRLQLRIFLCETDATNPTLSTFDGSVTSLDKVSRYQLEQLLKQLRISADIQEINEWSGNGEYSSILKQFTKNAEPDPTFLTEENMNRSRLYMQRVNQIIRQRSDQTAVSFIYLAAPPRIDSPYWDKISLHYLELLTELTVDLPPTILVHGVSTVTSTTL